MAYFALLRLWRGKYPLAISVSLNFILLICIFQGYLFGNTRYNSNTELPLTRRNVVRDAMHRSYIFVLVLTAPDSQQRRNAIRKTWLTSQFPKKYSFVHRFAVGTHELSHEKQNMLRKEQEENNDLLFLADFKDSYYNLTLKVLKSFVWIARNVEAKFVLKVDDDSFVQLGHLVVDLEKKEKFGRIYWGFFRGDANVKTSGPWKEPNWILCDKYLPYANGGGYILSQDLVHYIAKQQNMLQLYNSEDVSVGTWLAPVRLNRIHDVRFDTEYRSRGCNNKHIISHKQTIEDMFKKYEQLTNYDRLCEEETTERFSFDYDWNSKPSQCCKRTVGIP